MKKFLFVPIVKFLCFLSMAVCLFMFVFSGLGICIGYTENIFNSSGFNFFETEICQNMLSNDAESIATVFAYDENSYTDIPDEYHYENTNVAFNVYLIKDNIEMKVFNNEKIVTEAGATVNFYKQLMYEQDVSYRAELFLDSSLSVNDKYKAMSGWCQQLYENQSFLTTVCTVFGILALLFFSLLCIQAGRKRGKVAITFPTKLPLELVAIIVTAVGIVFWFFIAQTMIYIDYLGIIYNYGSIYISQSMEIDSYINNYLIRIALLTSIGASLTIVPFVLTVCARIKASKRKLKPMWRNFGILVLLKNIYVTTKNNFSYWLKSLPSVLVGALFFSAYVFINIILIISFQNIFPVSFFLCIVFNVCVLVIICIFFSNLDRLRKEILSLSQGEFGEILDSEKYLSFFKRYVDALNSLKAGMAVALEKSLKSERLKTELITNVSHDLKTPLTSIINYIDLLKNEDLSSPNASEKAKEYIEIIDSQSIRLKKLIDDLLEVSKASTGNTKVNLESIDITEFISQINGEFFERLENAGLTIIVNNCEENLLITADGSLLWRIFNNLISNVCKYSLAGTRVYLSAFTSPKDHQKVEIIVRNISSAPLNISAQELTERFVRGDSSRNTEGSGLGLSIAKSLTEAQNGSFDISIDGDLFKVILVFQKYTADNNPAHKAEDVADIMYGKTAKPFDNKEDYKPNGVTAKKDSSREPLYIDADIE